MRVIPDVDENAERSEKQKYESSKFGFLSDLLNQNLDFLKIGFPNAYQPLNYAIKKNISLVSKTKNGFEFDFQKAVFSEGKLAPVSPISLIYTNSATNPYSMQYRYQTDWNYLPNSPTDNIIGIVKIENTNTILFQKLAFKRNSLSNPPRCFFRNLNKYFHQYAQFSLFFYNGKDCSKTVYFGRQYIGNQ